MGRRSSPPPVRVPTRSSIPTARFADRRAVKRSRSTRPRRTAPRADRPSPFLPSAVGRKKIRIERIADERNRQVRPRDPTHLRLTRPRLRGSNTPEVGEASSEGSRSNPDAFFALSKVETPRDTAVFFFNVKIARCAKKRALPLRAATGDVHETQERLDEESDGALRVVRLPDRAGDF